MRALIITLLFGVLSAQVLLHAVVWPIDTVKLRSVSRFQQAVDRFTTSRAYQISYIGTPLIIGGLVVKGEDDHFRSLRNDYLPVFRYHYDDYLQYLPAAVMLGLKVGGVEGRSSWGRMLTSDVFSMALMATTVNTLKTTTRVTRPDGSNNHSFPSGHTATAFMTATMLSKEYGGRSPWYSIGAYMVATATGISRQLNNKHWLSDVMVGAGIGVLSTELGYYLADLIFKEKGIRHYNTSEYYDRAQYPSFFGISLGFSLIPQRFTLPGNDHIDLSAGGYASIEGAWFLNPYWGIGGRFSASNHPVLLNDVAQDESLDMITGTVGGYFSYPLTPRWLVGSKLLAGYGYFRKCKLSDFIIGGKGGFCVGTGCSMMFRVKENLGVKFYVDYTTLPSAVHSDDEITHILTLGSAINILF